MNVKTNAPNVDQLAKSNNNPRARDNEPLDIPAALKRNQKAKENEAERVERANERRTAPEVPAVPAEPVSTASLGRSASKEDVDKALDKIADDARKVAKLAGKNKVEIEQAAGRARQSSQMKRERDIASGVIN